MYWKLKTATKTGRSVIQTRLGLAMILQWHDIQVEETGSGKKVKKLPVFSLFLVTRF